MINISYIKDPDDTILLDKLIKWRKKLIRLMRKRNITSFQLKQYDKELKDCKNKIEQIRNRRKRK